MLVVTPDQKTAVYTDGMGDSYDMVNMATEGPEALYAGEGVMAVEAYGADATIALTLFDDDTCELSASIFGNSSVLDSGVYTVNADHSISFVFDNAGELTASLDTEVMGVVLEYSNEETALGAVQVSLPIVRAAQDASASALLFAFTGTYTTFEVYDDNSYVFGYEGAGLSETGAWAFENYQFTLTQANGNVITAAMDDAKNLTFEYVAEASDQLKDTFTCESAVWGPALVQ